MRAGLLAEFATERELLLAIRGLRDRGYRELDAYAPFPLRDAENALGLRRSRLPWLAFFFGLTGAATGYFVQWLTNAFLYPINVGGRPLHAVPAFVPITFESGVLAAGLTSLFGVFVLARLPALYDPVFDVSRFRSATIDRFWVSIDAKDPSFNRTQAMRDLEELGAAFIEWTGEEPAGEAAEGATR